MDIDPFLCDVRRMIYRTICATYDGTKWKRFVLNFIDGMYSLDCYMDDSRRYNAIELLIKEVERGKEYDVYVDDIIAICTRKKNYYTV